MSAAILRQLNARGAAFIPVATSRQTQARAAAAGASAAPALNVPAVPAAAAESVAANLGIWGPAQATGVSLVNFGPAALRAPGAPNTVWLISVQPQMPVYPASDGPAGATHTFPADTYFVIAVDPSTGKFIEASDG